MSDNKYNLSFDRNKSNTAAQAGGDESDDVLFAGDAGKRSNNAFGTKESSFSDKPKRTKSATAAALAKTRKAVVEVDVAELGGSPAAPLTSAQPAKKNMGALFEQPQTSTTKAAPSAPVEPTPVAEVVEPVKRKPAAVPTRRQKSAVGKVSPAAAEVVAEVVEDTEAAVPTASGTGRSKPRSNPAVVPAVLAVAGLAAGFAIYQGTGRVPVAAAAAGLGVIGAVVSYLTPRKR